jgi:hypothetical protein
LIFFWFNRFYALFSTILFLCYKPENPDDFKGFQPTEYENLNFDLSSESRNSLNLIIKIIHKIINFLKEGIKIV